MSHHRGRSGSPLARLRSRDRSRERRREHKAETKRQGQLRRLKLLGANFVMPYGVWKGKRILLVPRDYLCWITRETGHQLAGRARAELERRDRVKARGAT